jgi:hypothetical protein
MTPAGNRDATGGRDRCLALPACSPASQIDPRPCAIRSPRPTAPPYAGLQRLEAHDFRGLIKETVLAAKARSEELSKDT